MSRDLNIKYLDVITVESESFLKYENEIYNNNDIFEFINKIFSEKKLSRLLVKCFYNDDFGDDNAGCFFEYIEPAGPQDVDNKPKYLANNIFKSMEDNNIFFKENKNEDIHPAWTTEKIREFMREGVTFNSHKASPNHYKFGDMEVIDMIRETLSIEQFKGFCMGNIIKYRMRAGKKEGSDDIAKAFKYEKYMEDKK